MKTIIEKVMGPTGLWHLTATDIDCSSDNILCGLSNGKINPSSKREPIGWWSFSKICSNCWHSKIATKARADFLYPRILTASGSTHSWRRFSDEVVDNSTTASRLIYKYTSAKVLYFGVINEGWIERALPENPGALPVVEAFGNENNIPVMRAFIVDTIGKDLVYYPLKTLTREDEEILGRHDYMLHNSNIELNKIDYIVISGAVQAALNVPEYFIPRKR